MARFVEFSCLNPLQFAQGNKVLPSAYNTKYFDAGFPYSETIKSYEDDKDFTHKLRFNDWISLQIIMGPVIDGFAAPKIYLQDCHNEVINEEIPYIEAQAGTLVQDYDTPVGVMDVYVFQYNFPLSAFFTTNRQGSYRFKVRCSFSDGDSPAYEDHYSEWIDVRDTHPGTVLISYHNTINDFDTWFEQLHPRFAMRVEGDVHSYEPGATVTGYAAQNEEFTQLSSVPYDTQKLTVINAPDFLIKKLNHIFSCSDIAIDGKSVVRDDGAKFEIQRIENHPLKGVTLQLRSGENKHGLEIRSKRTYFEWTGYTTPKFYHNLQLNNFIGQLIILRDNYILEAGAEAAFAATLTSEAASYGLSGTFGYTGDQLYYDNADTENFYAGLDKIMSGLMSVDVTLPATNPDGSPRTNIPFFFTSKGGYLGVDWGDSSALDFYTPPTGSFSPQHTYATPDDYTIRIFHDGPASATTILSFQQQQIVPATRVVTNITGLAPDSLQVFSLNYADLDSSFRLSFLQKAWQNLKQLIVEDCNMVHPFTGSLFTYGTSPKWAQLKLLDFRNNQISVTGVDNVFVEFTAGAYYGFILGAGNGRFKIEGQSPSAPPSSTSSSNRAALVSQNWTITND